MIGNTYIPPENSRYQSLTPFQELQDELIKFGDCYFCIAGDLNSHTGKKRDHVESSDFTEDQLNFDVEAQTNVASLKYLQNNNIKVNRQNESSQRPNPYGNLLLQLCKTNNLFIGNGRIDSDPTGKVTTTDGSLIDYMVASPTILTKVEQLIVHDFDAIFSDIHCRVSWTLNCPNKSHGPNNKNNSNFINVKKSHRNMWSRSKAPDFSHHINLNDISSIREDIGNSSNNINNVTDKIQDLFKCVADIVLGPEYEYKIDINRKRKCMRLDRETLNKRNKYYAAKRANKGTEETKTELKNTSKEYKKAILKAKAISRKQKIKKLRNAKTKDPKFYWSVLNCKNNHKIRNSKNTPDICTIFEEFIKLSGTGSPGDFNNDIADNSENSNISNVDIELAEQILNALFTEEEILACVKKLKNGKACGEDKILNEFIKCTFDQMKRVYVDLFNRILRDGQIPESWTMGMIVPIYKNKGDKSDANNYRGITILSCLGKLFTSVINDRLTKFADESKLINENQTGFRKSYSTLNHIFLLNNIIDILVKNAKGKKLFCAFVDYKKAFDTVWRSALWHKLIKSGISGKILNVMENMYKNIKSCISYNGNSSDYFVSLNGVRQGENLSPFLFAIFINDIEQHLIQYGCNPINVLNPDMQIFLKLLVIMYADDTVLFSDTEEGLQKCLNGLKAYCDKWKLQINTEKTKVMIFSKNKVKAEDFNFTIGDKSVEIVYEFQYLGITFSYNGNFSANFQYLKKKGLRAMYGIIKKARAMSLPIDLQFELFDRVVLPAMLNGCEIWGYKNLDSIEKVHLKFCKHVLKLKSATSNAMVYGETGRFSMEYYVKKRMINFWSKIVCGDKNKLSFIIYDLCKQTYDRGLPSTDWFHSIVSLMSSCGIHNLPVTIDEVKAVTKQIHKSLKLEFVNKWEGNINEPNSKCSILYKHIKTVFESEYYLTNLPHNLRVSLSKIRTCNHRLPIETGRYTRRKVPRENRICTKCNSGQVGDEYHFILTCSNPTLIELREKYISPYYSGQPSIVKLGELFGNKGKKLFKLARYVEEGLKLY